MDSAFQLGEAMDYDVWSSLTSSDLTTVLKAIR